MIVASAPVYYAPVPYPVLPAPIILPPVYFTRDQFCYYCGHAIYWMPYWRQWYCPRCRIYIPTEQPKRSLF